MFPALIIFAIIFSFYPSPMGARIYFFCPPLVLGGTDTTISHQKSLSKPIKTTKNHHFLSLCLRFRWGWQKLKRTLYFQYQTVVGISTHQLKNQEPSIKSALLTLYTNFIKYRPKYRKTLLKSTLLPTSNPNQKPQSKPLSSYINIKI